MRSPFGARSTALAVVLAASAFGGACARPEPSAVALGEHGIGPLLLDRSYDDAVAAARRLAPDSLLAGPGCGGLDEIRYSGHMAEFPVSLMAMARNDRLVEVELGLDAPLTAANEAACLGLRDRFAAPFVDRFGAASGHWTIDKPVSREHLLGVGPVVVVARWFVTGNSCYVSARYGDAGTG